MQRIYETNIANRVFTLNEDAYTLLSAYITVVKKHYNNQPDGATMVSNLESRIAASLPQGSIITIEQISSILDLLDTPNMTKKARQEAYKQNAAEQGGAHSEEDEDDIDQPTTGVKVFRIILRIISGVAGGILAFWWLYLCCIAMIMSLTGLLNYFGQNILGEAVGFGVSVMQFFVGFISLPWFFAVYLLLCFAFNARIRKWVIWSVLFLWLLIVISLGSNLDTSLVDSIDSADNSIELLEEKIESKAETIKQQAETFADSVEQRFEKIENLLDY